MAQPADAKQNEDAARERFKKDTGNTAKIRSQVFLCVLKDLPKNEHLRLGCFSICYRHQIVRYFRSRSVEYQKSHEVVWDEEKQESRVRDVEDDDVLSNSFVTSSLVSPETRGASRRKIGFFGDFLVFFGGHMQNSDNF